MLESDLAKHFGQILSEYQIWIPNNRTAGWPDRGVQLKGSSSIVWAELKVLRMRLQSPMVLVSRLEPEQAAWLAKWQRQGGYCFLFLGFTGRSGELVEYGILQRKDWTDWLKVPTHSIPLDQFLLFDQHDDILKWFKVTFPLPGEKRLGDFRGCP